MVARGQGRRALAVRGAAAFGPQVLLLGGAVAAVRGEGVGAGAGGGGDGAALPGRHPQRLLRPSLRALLARVFFGQRRVDDHRVAALVAQAAVSLGAAPLLQAFRPPPERGGAAADGDLGLERGAEGGALGHGAHALEPLVRVRGARIAGGVAAPGPHLVLVVQGVGPLRQQVGGAAVLRLGPVPRRQAAAVAVADVVVSAEPLRALESPLGHGGHGTVLVQLLHLGLQARDGALRRRAVQEALGPAGRPVPFPGGGGAGRPGGGRGEGGGVLRYVSIRPHVTPSPLLRRGVSVTVLLRLQGLRGGVGGLDGQAADALGAVALGAGRPPGRPALVLGRQLRVALVAGYVQPVAPPVHRQPVGAVPAASQQGPLLLRGVRVAAALAAHRRLAFGAGPSRHGLVVGLGAAHVALVDQVPQRLVHVLLLHVAAAASVDLRHALHVLVAEAGVAEVLLGRLLGRHLVVLVQLAALLRGRLRGLVAVGQRAAV